MHVQVGFEVAAPPLPRGWRALAELVDLVRYARVVEFACVRDAFRARRTLRHETKRREAGEAPGIDGGDDRAAGTG